MDELPQDALLPPPPSPGLRPGASHQVQSPKIPLINPILHTAWLESHALTLKNNTAKYYFGEKSSFLHTFLKFSPEF